MKILVCFLLVAVGVGGYWFGWRQGRATPRDRGRFRPPTAAEVFNLRSKCAELGQKILDGNLTGPALTQSQVSHYDPETNRCYVRLDVDTADLTVPPEKAYRDSYTSAHN